MCQASCTAQPVLEADGASLARIWLASGSHLTAVSGPHSPDQTSSGVRGARYRWVRGLTAHRGVFCWLLRSLNQ
jgi:hypothetical protein